MELFNKIRNRALNRALEQFIADKPPIKLPNLQRINSILIILEDNEKGMIRGIESSVKSLFGTSRCGFVILSSEMSENMLQSDLYNEITPKDFGFMSVLKPERHEYVRKLPTTNMIINMARRNSEVSDYICTLPRTDFRISFHKSEHIAIYDLVIETPAENADPVYNIHVLHDYLVALIGKPENKPY